MSEAGPRIVALVPTWRAESFIQPTLDALSAQTCRNLEILISDDASPDRTAELCEAQARGDPRVRVVRQPRNLGWIGNANFLLRAARGDFAWFAFHDDLPAPTYATRCAEALRAYPDAVAAFSDIELIDQAGARSALSYRELDGVSDAAERGRRMVRQDENWWIPNRALFRLNVAQAIGGMRRHLAGEVKADWPWLLELSLRGPFVRVPENLMTKIYTPQSLSRGWRHSLFQRTAVALSALQGVWRSPASMGVKSAATRSMGTLMWGYLRVAVGRRLRRP